MKNPPKGYYHPALGWKNRFAEKNFFGVWQPDNLVATIRLQRVEHPIPLWVKNVTLGLDKDVSSLPDGKFHFDFLAGDFLPPLGKGRHADVMFTRVAREDRGEGENGANVKGRSFRDTIRVCFLGEENGLVEMKCDNGNGIRIRQAFESGRHQNLAFRMNIQSGVALERICSVKARIIKTGTFVFAFGPNVMPKEL